MRWLALLLVACYAPRYEGVACGPGGDCPAGTVCGAEGLCSGSLDGEGQIDAEVVVVDTPDASIEIIADADPGPTVDAGDSLDAAEDLQPPTTMLETALPPFVASDAAQIAFHGNEVGTVFACRMDGAAYAPCSSPFATGPLGEGEHIFEVYARDLAGNAEWPPQFLRWTVDLTSPSTSITSGPPPFSGSSVVFALDASEPAQGYECSLDGAAFSACTPPVTLAGLPNGARSFRARAIDRAGLTGAPSAPYDWTVDPAVFSTSIEAGPGALSGRDVSFTFGSTRPGSTFECSLDPAGAPSYTDCSNPKAYLGLAGGAHTLHVRAENPVGTYAASIARTWTVDATGPTVTISDAGVPPASGWSNAVNLTFSLSCNDAPCVFECRLDGAAFQTMQNASCPLSNLAEGSHTVSVRATDPRGNLGGTVNRGWKTDRTSPTLSITPVEPCYSASTMTVTFAANDANTIDTRTCRLTRTSASGTDVDDRACAGTSSHLVTGLTGPASYSLRITVTDPAGNPRSATVSWQQKSATLCGD